MRSRGLGSGDREECQHTSDTVVAIQTAAQTANDRLPRGGTENRGVYVQSADITTDAPCTTRVAAWARIRWIKFPDAVRPDALAGELRRHKDA